jgi:hypothetical protein
MKKIKFYCVTNKLINFINNEEYNLAWVGKNNPPSNYLKCNYKDNIFYKEKNYSELTFHYWYWKNLLHLEKDDQWIGFCQKRRYWIKKITTDTINVDNINDYLLTNLNNDCFQYEALICNPIKISGAKTVKLLKRGWRNVLRQPLILFDDKFQNIKVHFDMHHGYGNLEKAIKLLDENDRDDFYEYVRLNNKFNPHIMFISKKKFINKWFEALFPWLERCEKEFGFDNLSGYETTRIYAYLSERYLSFWFKKYTNYKEHPWTFINF